MSIGGTANLIDNMYLSNIVILEDITIANDKNLSSINIGGNLECEGTLYSICCNCGVYNGLKCLKCSNQEHLDDLKFLITHYRKDIISLCMASSLYDLNVCDIILKY
jgi:hypothetical protein